MRILTGLQMTLVVVPKFNCVDVLKCIQRYRVNFLKCVHFTSPLHLADLAHSVVPPMIVLLCKVSCSSLVSPHTRL